MLPSRNRAVKGTPIEALDAFRVPFDRAAAPSCAGVNQSHAADNTILPRINLLCCARRTRAGSRHARGARASARRRERRECVLHFV